MAIKLKAHQPTSVKLSVQEQGAVSLRHLNDVVGIASDPYEGEYTVDPSESAQTLLTNSKTMLDDVTVTAIPGDYVGSQVERRDGDDLVATGNLVNVPAGFYEENCGKEIAYGAVAVPSVNIEAHPVVTTDSNGLILASVSESESVSPAVTNGYVTAEQGHAGTITFAGTASSQLSTQGATSIHPSTSSQTAAPSGVFTTGAITVEAMDLETVSKSYTPSTSAQSETITPSDGKDGISQVNVSVSAMPTGYRGAATISATWNSSKRFYTTTYGSATDGYYPATQWNNIPAVEMTRVTETVTPTESTQEITPQSSYHYIDKVTVNPIPSQYIVPTGTANITANGTGIDVSQYATADVAVSPILTMGTIRPDAELIKTVTYDKWIVQDEEITLPGYTTTATTLKASSDLTDDTVTFSYGSYNYYVLERMLTIPKYSEPGHGKGRVEYHVSSYLYEIGEILPNSFITLDGNAKAYTSRTVSVVANGMYRLFYWNAATTVTAYSTAAYGVYQTATAPTVSSGVLTLKTPALLTRGSTTYFTSTYMSALTDIRYQWVIQVYRAPKSNLNLDGFGQTTHLAHILNCVNNNNQKLV